MLHKYKFYIDTLNHMEHLEIWQNGEWQEKSCAPLGEQLMSLVNDPTKDSVLVRQARSFCCFFADNTPFEYKKILTPYSLNVCLENRDEEIIEVLYTDSISEIFNYTIIKMNQEIKGKHLWLIRCKRCHRIFANFKHGRNVVYCDYKDSFGKSCREIVAERVDGWMKSDYDRKIQKIFVKYYNEQQRKRKRKQVTTEQVAIWSKKARAIRDQCQKGEITEEDFIKWLDENKENYNGQIT